MCSNRLSSTCPPKSSPVSGRTRPNSPNRSTQTNVSTQARLHLRCPKYQPAGIKWPQEARGLFGGFVLRTVAYAAQVLVFNLHTAPAPCRAACARLHRRPDGVPSPIGIMGGYFCHRGRGVRNLQRNLQKKYEHAHAYVPSGRGSKEKGLEARRA